MFEVLENVNDLVISSNYNFNQNYIKSILDDVNSDEYKFYGKNYNSKYYFLLKKFLNIVNLQFKTDFNSTLELANFVYCLYDHKFNMIDNFKSGYYNLCYCNKIYIEIDELKKLVIKLD